MKNQLYFNRTQETYHRTLAAALKRSGEVRRLSMRHDSRGSKATYPEHETLRNEDGSLGFRVTSNAATAEEKATLGA